MTSTELQVFCCIKVTFGLVLVLSCYLVSTMAKAPSGDTEDASSPLDYYDIMVIGRTGMGKSTTSDKMLIASLNEHNFFDESDACEMETGERLIMSDFSMWLFGYGEGEIRQVKERLKDLKKSRKKAKPHLELNEIYKMKEPSSRSELISNDTTKVRILDVPGFFGEYGMKQPSESQQTSERVNISGLRIMREILRIQVTMKMNFRRIVYFIPERGPLERPHKVLQMELEQMFHYFGKSIFDCMVLITTQPASIYKFIPPDKVPFSDEDELMTRDHFSKTLCNVLSVDQRLPDGKPPIVFISMHDSCNDVIKKIQHAPVICNTMKLAFDCQACIRCGIKAKLLTIKDKEYEKVACYAGEDPSESVPYEESFCHPLIISKYWKITKVVGGIVHVVTRKKYIGKWPDFCNRDDEICVKCGQVPGTEGCHHVRTPFELKGKAFLVDHTYELNEPIVVDEHREVLQELSPATDDDQLQQEDHSNEASEILNPICLNEPPVQSESIAVSPTQGR